MHTDSRTGRMLLEHSGMEPGMTCYGQYRQDDETGPEVAAQYAAHLHPAITPILHSSASNPLFYQLNTDTRSGNQYSAVLSN
jgi:hypothetical protein